MLRIIQYLGALACIALIVTCFIPWVTYVQAGETFTGMHTTRFPNGNYYGKPGWLMITISVIILACLFISHVMAKRLALFMVAFLIAYAIRTFNLFTSSLFPTDVIKHTGIYLMLLFPFLIGIACLFPNMKGTEENTVTGED